MLIEFSVENYLSFKDKVTLSMVASKDKSLPGNVIKSVQDTDFDLLKTAAIYGANASGKSNLINALLFMKWFAFNTLDGEKEPWIKVAPYKLDSHCQSQPSTFEVTFLWEGVRYQYGFSIKSKSVCEEWFYSYPKKQQRVLFEREQVKGKKESRFKFGTHWEGLGQSLKKVTLPNTLFISVASLYDNKYAKIVRRWFEEKLNHVPWISLFGFEHEFAVDLTFNEGKMKQVVLKFLRHADLGINDFNINKKAISEWGLLALMPDQFRKSFINMLPDNDAPLHEIKTVHSAIDENDEEINVDFDFDEESDGTQRFFQLAGPIYNALNSGSCLIMDELNVRLHPLLAKWLIENFHNEKFNPKKAQLVFTTHDSTLIDNELFRRDQIWFTEKDKSGATDLYSLWDFKINKARKDENYEKGYLAGRYGAIPFIGDVSD